MYTNLHTDTQIHLNNFLKFYRKEKPKKSDFLPSLVKQPFYHFKTPSLSQTFYMHQSAAWTVKTTKNTRNNAALRVMKIKQVLELHNSKESSIFYNLDKGQ